MSELFPKFKAAAVHAASVFLDLEASIDKACKLIGEAAANGANLVVFPETFLPGYPYWIWTHTPRDGAPLFFELFANSIVVGSTQTDRLGAAARQAGVYVAVGVSERDGGTLYNTLLYFDNQGDIVGRHRKLQPTNAERIIWGRGDASGLKVHQTPLGRIGGLICFEHTMDLTRYALISQREQVHVGIWPAISAISSDPNSATFDDWSASAARHHALAAQAFVINVQSRIDERVIEKLGLVGQTDVIRVGGGWSAIIAPNGQFLAGPNRDDETILYADIDLSLIVFAKYFVDSAGHYSRPDVLRLWANYETQSVTVDEERPARFVDTDVEDGQGETAPMPQSFQQRA